MSKQWHKKWYVSAGEAVEHTAQAVETTLADGSQLRAEIDELRARAAKGQLRQAHIQRLMKSLEEVEKRVRKHREALPDPP